MKSTRNGEIPYLLSRCIEGGFIDFDKYKEFENMRASRSERQIESELTIDNYTFKYSFEESFARLFYLSCYDKETNTILFNWNDEIIFYEVNGASKSKKIDKLISKKIIKCIKTYVKKQDPWFFVKLDISELIFDLAKPFKQRYSIYQKIWGIGVSYRYNYVMYKHK